MMGLHQVYDICLKSLRLYYAMQIDFFPKKNVYLIIIGLKPDDYNAINLLIVHHIYLC